MFSWAYLLSPLSFGNRGAKFPKKFFRLFDGKDYPVPGDSTSDMRSYKKIGDRVMKITVKKDGKVTLTGRVVVSADGNSRIVTTGEAGAEGKSPKNRAVYDKQ
jgi:hypothetical protein